MRALYKLREIGRIAFFNGFELSKQPMYVSDVDNQEKVEQLLVERHPVLRHIYEVNGEIITIIPRIFKSIGDEFNPKLEVTLAIQMPLPQCIFIMNEYNMFSETLNNTVEVKYVRYGVVQEALKIYGNQATRLYSTMEPSSPITFMDREGLTSGPHCDPIGATIIASKALLSYVAADK